MHLGAFQALPLNMSILSGAWLTQPAVMFLSIFISSVDWKTVLKRETRPRCSKSWKAASPGMLLTFPPPQNLISEPTNPDFWGNKSWRLREKSVLMLMQGAVGIWRTCSSISKWSTEDDTDALSKGSSHVYGTFACTKIKEFSQWRGLESKLWIICQD